MSTVVKARRVWGPLAAAAATLLLAGCAGDPFGPQRAPGSVYQLEPLQPGQRAIVEWQDRISALDEVLADNAAVIVGVPVRQEMVPAPGLYTITVFQVREVLHGSVAGHEVEVFHTGPVGETHDMQHPEFLSIPEPGLEYLLILRPRNPEWEPYADYHVAGPGQWVREFPDQRFALDLHDHRMLSLGHTIPLDTSIDEFVHLLDGLAR